MKKYIVAIPLLMYSQCWAHASVLDWFKPVSAQIQTVISKNPKACFAAAFLSGAYAYRCYTALSDENTDAIAITKPIRLAISLWHTIKNACTPTINRPNDDGDTSLHLAIKLKQTENTLELIRKNAAVTTQNDVGDTPLHLAIAHNQTKVAEELLAAGAHSNVQNKAGKTPLMYAIKHGNMAIAKKLVTEKKCNINLKQVDGTTTLDVAIDHAHPDFIDLLLESKVSMRSAYATPLHHVIVQTNETNNQQRQQSLNTIWTKILNRTVEHG